MKSEPSGAAVYIDDDWRGVTPNKFEVTPGRHDVIVKKGNGWTTFKQTIDIPKGRDILISVPLYEIKVTKSSVDDFLEGIGFARDRHDKERIPYHENEIKRCQVDIKDDSGCAFKIASIIIGITLFLSLIIFKTCKANSVSPQDDYYEVDSIEEVVDSVATDSISISEETVHEMPSEAEIFEQAYKNKNWVIIEQLGNKGYVHAYYPLALHYYQISNFKSCEAWASKAIRAGVDISKASGLFTEIEAEEAYEKAELYFSNEYKAYDKAIYYAQKAGALSKNHSKRLSEIINICKKFNPPPYSE